MAKLTFSIGGIHPADKKLAKDCKIETLPLPPKVYVSMFQHLGAMAKPVVTVGDSVKAGQIIAEPGGFISAYIHSPVSGKVTAIGPRKDLAGFNQMHIEIEVQGDEWAEGIDLSPELVTAIPEDRDFILDRIKMNGVVGLGGATFPTHVKLNPPPGKTAGCPCVIGIEENKPEAIEAVRASVNRLGYPGIRVATLRKRYPQGGEKQLIDAVMHRQVRSGGLPIDVGAVVQNVATSLAVYEAVQKNKPLVTNTLTVTGDVIDPARQHNYLFRIGMPLSYIAEYAGGVPEGTVKIVSGGPMMGKAIANLDAATVKGSSSILYLGSSTLRHAATPCISCGRCADACPMGLEPFLLKRLYDAQDIEALEKNAAQDCIECGCCQYSCPAYVPLLDNIRMAKAQVMGVIRARNAKK